MVVLASYDHHEFNLMSRNSHGLINTQGDDFADTYVSKSPNVTPALLIIR